MKKFYLLCVMLALVLLCSCKNAKIQNTDADNLSNDESTAQYSSLEERPISDATNSGEESSSDSNDKSNESDYSEEEAVTDISDLTIETDQPYYLANDTKITFVIYNTKSGSFKYNTDFFLQIYEDGSWQYYHTQSGEINYQYNIATSNESFAYVTMNLADDYIFPLRFGTYRIIQENEDGSDSLISNTFEIVSEEYNADEEQITE